ncbi:uncharacterized protein LOC129801853 [Phlebotomus papatasi]|uniref:uncharacterized protein LOC129801853 n=1 Tax=Phlebotomus papatasi TaxID=29031 RepID=UPI0024844F3E|nr:uncharacterized protein LOC129801853 [Phlebotomus papatasi]
MVNTNGLIYNGKKYHRGNGHGGLDERTVGTFTEEPFLKPRVTEQSLAGVLFLITVLILIGKLTFMLKSSVQSALQWRQLVKRMWTDPTSGQDFITFSWESGFRGQFLIWPLVCGFIAFIFTWFMIYFDSRIPGVDPLLPSIFGQSSGSTKYLSEKNRRWPLAYKTSVLVGLLAFTLMLVSPKL